MAHEAPSNGANEGSQESRIQDERPFKATRKAAHETDILHQPPCKGLKDIDNSLVTNSLAMEELKRAGNGEEEAMWYPKGLRLGIILATCVSACIYEKFLPTRLLLQDFVFACFSPTSKSRL